MAMPEPLHHALGVNPSTFSKEESVILEAELFTRICDELKIFFKATYIDYFRFLKFSIEMENEMMEEKLVRCVINDILATEEYSLAGIACYTKIPEDVVYEMATGNNINPSSQFLRRIIALHRSVRPTLYQEIMNKIINIASTTK